MKRIAIIVFATLLLAGCGPRKVTEFYARYKDRPGVNVVSFVGYRINDSIRADVTVVQAVDDSVYAALLPEFGLTRTRLGFQKVVVSGPAVSVEGNPLVRTIGTSVTQRSIYIFDCESDCSNALIQFMADVTLEYINKVK
ncbi:MAG: hypothetical protein IJ785_02310 [Bacteroidales bacterium]|nr:hypothetical protein [Bacteroidales bacterium]